MDLGYKYVPVNRDIDCQRSISKGGFYVPWYHAHANYEMALVVSGNLHIMNNGECVQTQFPCLVIHKPYSVHVMHADKEVPYERYIVSFKTERLEDVFANFPSLDMLFKSNLSVFKLSQERLEIFCELLERFYKVRNDSKRCKFWLGLLMCEVMDMQGEEIGIATGNVPQYIQNVMIYIEENYAKELRTADIAKQFYVSQAKLNSDFRKYTTTTLHSFLVGIRLRKAQQLLIKKHSVVDSALSCGFKNECHFIRCFKENFGITPYQYALQYRN